MLTDYITKQMSRARYKKLGDGTYFGHVPGLRGVWANAKMLPRCRSELREVLEEWLIFRLEHRMSIPSWLKAKGRSISTLARIRVAA